MRVRDDASFASTPRHNVRGSRGDPLAFLPVGGWTYTVHNLLRTDPLHAARRYFRMGSLGDAGTDARRADRTRGRSPEERQPVESTRLRGTTARCIGCIYATARNYRRNGKRYAT